MRSFQQIIAILFAFLVCAFATDAPASGGEYSTLYITSTVYRVNTITVSGTAMATMLNSTATPYATGAYPTHGASNSSAASTGPAVRPSSPPFTGAASATHANALLAAMAAGLGYLVL